MNEPVNMPSSDQIIDGLTNGFIDAAKIMQRLEEEKVNLEWRLFIEQGRLEQYERRIAQLYELARNHWSMPVGEALTEFGKMR